MCHGDVVDGVVRRLVYRSCNGIGTLKGGSKSVISEQVRDASLVASRGTRGERSDEADSQTEVREWFVLYDNRCIMELERT